MSPRSVSQVLQMTALLMVVVVVRCPLPVHSLSLSLCLSGPSSEVAPSVGARMRSACGQVSALALSLAWLHSVAFQHGLAHCAQRQVSRLPGTLAHCELAPSGVRVAMQVTGANSVRLVQCPARGSAWRRLWASTPSIPSDAPEVSPVARLSRTPLWGCRASCGSSSRPFLGGATGLEDQHFIHQTSRIWNSQSALSFAQDTCSEPLSLLNEPDLRVENTDGRAAILNRSRSSLPCASGSVALEADSQRHTAEDAVRGKVRSERRVRDGAVRLWCPPRQATARRATASGAR